MKEALFTFAYTHTTDGTNMQTPWGGYPGFTSVQEQDFNRAGEDAFLLGRVMSSPRSTGSGCMLWRSWARTPMRWGSIGRTAGMTRAIAVEPTEGVPQGLSIRLRYALVQQDGGDVHDVKDFRDLQYLIEF